MNTRGGKLLIALFAVAWITPLAAQSIPDPIGYVNDFADVISSSYEREIEKVIVAVVQQTGAEIAVVTVPDMEPYGSIDQYGIALAEQWGVGADDEDNGLIFILSMAERQVRIEVGYGLEGVINDGKAGAILDTYVLPDFRNGDYGNGFLNGVSAAAVEIANEYGVTLTNVELVEPAQTESSFDFGNLFYLIFILVAFGGRFFLWPLLFVGRRRGFFGGGFGSGSSSSGGSSFRGFSGGGGFGGGGFGGGGASRGF